MIPADPKFSGEALAIYGPIVLDSKSMLLLKTCLSKEYVEFCCEGYCLQSQGRIRKVKIDSENVYFTIENGIVWVEGMAINKHLAIYPSNNDSVEVKITNKSKGTTL